MNSISYLDSVLSRSFASDKKAVAAPKRSRSHSSLPGSRRGLSRSGSSATTPTRPSSSHRRPGTPSDDFESEANSASSSTWSHPLNARLTRIDSTPARTSSASRSCRHARHSDDDDQGVDDDDDGQGRLGEDVGVPQARWGALWGLTGWIDGAINPTSGAPHNRSKKNSLTESSSSSTRDGEASTLPSKVPRTNRRVPSLDSLLMSSTAPSRHSPRRTASSGTSRGGDGSNQARADTERSGTSQIIRRKDNRRRRSGFGQAASLTMTNGHPTGACSQTEEPNGDERDLMNEREREDIVDFDGGDFPAEDLEVPVTAQGISRDWEEQHSRQDAHDSQSGSDTASSADKAQQADNAQYPSNLLGETFSPCSGSETSKAFEAVELGTAGSRNGVSLYPAIEAQDEPLHSAPPPYQEDEAPSPSISRRGSQSASRQREVAALEEHASDALASPPCSVSTANWTLTPASSGTGTGAHRSVSRRRNQGSKGSSSSSTPDSGADSSSVSSASGWLSARPSPSRVVSSGSSATRKTRFSLSRAFRKALIALRDILLAILTSPITGIKLLSGKQRRERRATAVTGDSALGGPDGVAVLLKEEPDPIPVAASESLKDADSKNDADQGEKVVPLMQTGLRFAQTDSPLKRPRSNSGRPRTPRPEHAPAAAYFPQSADSDAGSELSSGGSKADNESDDDEPITEEQAIARAEKLRSALLSRAGPMNPEHPQRPQLVASRSRLLPNPHPIDPMLAHDRKAQPIDEDLAREEARLQAERKAKVAARRAARRGIELDASVTGTPSELTALSISSQIHAKLPRGPSSSVIHHSPKILVLDLDETLIHSTSRSPSYLNSAGQRVSTGGGVLGLESLGAILGLRANENPGRIRPHMVEVVLEGRSVIYHVYKRPWVDYFLRKVASWYHVVIFTASVQEYADPVIDWLDQGRGLISGRLFREACTYKNGSYVKNLQVVDNDLSTVCLVDNSPASYAHNQANGIPIEGWTHDPNDEALLDLLPILDSLRFATDVRHILGIRGFSA